MAGIQIGLGFGPDIYERAAEAYAEGGKEALIQTIVGSYEVTTNFPFDRKIETVADFDEAVNHRLQDFIGEAMAEKIKAWVGMLNDPEDQSRHNLYLVTLDDQVVDLGHQNQLSP